MKSFTGYLVGAVVLALLGGLCLAAGMLEREIAYAQQGLATLSYDDPEATFETAERYFTYGSHLPWIGNGPLNDVRARKAAMYYWQREYGRVVPQETDPVAAIPEDNVELQLVVANAVYRSGQMQATDRQTTLDALEAGIGAYLTVVKNAGRHEAAAYNYEFLVRLRSDIEKGRHKPGLADGDEDGPLGRAGGPAVPDSNIDNLKIHVPLESEELEKDAAGTGKAGRNVHKG